MTSVVFVDTDASIVFTAHPQDNCVRENENAYFRCEYIGTSSRPNWMINGEQVLASSLPPKHFLNKTGMIVTSVNRTMNNWTYACFFLIFIDSNVNQPQLLVSQEGSLKVLIGKSLYAN